MDARNRTPDQPLWRRPLYQLSYIHMILRAPPRVRTATGQGLSLVPLPVGLEGLVHRRVSTPGSPISLGLIRACSPVSCRDHFTGRTVFYLELRLRGDDGIRTTHLGRRQLCQLSYIPSDPFEDRWVTPVSGALADGRKQSSRQDGILVASPGLEPGPPGFQPGALPTELRLRAIRLRRSGSVCCERHARRASYRIRDSNPWSPG